mgnify:CR=1 FL=1
MLDAFIIEKIKRDEERRRRDRAPLTIEKPEPPRRRPETERKDDPSTPNRGVVIIDL